jgi:hypothetical protein
MPKRPDVEAWFKAYDNPMKEVVLYIREVALAADPRVDECIKWQAPTFTALGKNIASFFPKAKQHASLMFHDGAKIPGKPRLLEGGGEVSRVMKIASLAEAQAARAEIAEIIRGWLAVTESSSKAAPSKRGKNSRGGK